MVSYMCRDAGPRRKDEGRAGGRGRDGVGVGVSYPHLFQLLDYKSSRNSRYSTHVQVPCRVLEAEEEAQRTGAGLSDRVAKDTGSGNP